ncbi:MAG: hypothetical protein QS98_C0011G0065 [archaeon GW2011_AR3]|nr:MAG: hypothetical protein QS98_C0011G0065 [archaeon GW2011_AR3]MBS3109672.1 radical SAM protein [Candidatus Woesearchaeota archaeon]
MAELSFETLTFSGSGENIECTFLKLFSFEIAKDDLKRIGDFSLTSSRSILFPKTSQEQADRKFGLLLSAGFSRLRNKLSKKPAVYLHRNSGIPLIGSLFIGISDKNVSTIEVKPITSCNTDCIFCSVDLTRRATDFVVEKEYMLQEVKKLVDYKGSDYIEINVNPHGEPTLYADLPGLVKGLRAIPQIKDVSMNTNATLLTQKLMDDLIDAGMTRFNVSLHSLNPEKSKFLFNSKTYNIERVKESCKYLARRGVLLLAPVWVPGHNDADMDELIEFAKVINAPIRIQNYQIHTLGKKVKKTKEKHWDQFFEEIKAMEQKHGVSISGVFPGFVLKPTKKLEMPFKLGDIATARLACPAEFKGDMLAVCKDRVISVQGCGRASGTVKLRITRAKNNTFFGELVK